MPTLPSETGTALRLRAVSEGDSEAIWTLANEPEVRALSFNRAVIPWETHRRWFREKMADPDCRLWVVIDPEDHVVGQVRFDIERGIVAVVSIGIAREWRGRGHGVHLLREGCILLFSTTDVGRVLAYVKLDNVRSLHAFERAGFARVRTLTCDGSDSAELLLLRPPMPGSGP